MLVTSQLPIETTRLFIVFLTYTCSLPHFEKGSATHVVTYHHQWNKLQITCFTCFITQNLLDRRATEVVWDSSKYYSWAAAASHVLHVVRLKFYLSLNWVEMIYSTCLFCRRRCLFQPKLELRTISLNSSIYKLALETNRQVFWFHSIFFVSPIW